jgi:hypothetical protein
LRQLNPLPLLLLLPPPLLPQWLIKRKTTC